MNQFLEMDHVLDEKTSLKARLQRLLAQMQEEDDRERADKIKDLLDKLERGKADFAFCGHFSAGKSSLVNLLCGAAILPSSPIPTSANVVTIENGEEHVLVERMNEEPVQTTVSELDQACRDGATIRRIHIRYPVPLLADRARLVDTPGVDSTDDLHRKATEDALHMADAVFYVMDYNHVLSEMNFRYIRLLAEYGKPLFLIVNQIDKHRDSELKFADFRDKVQEALHDWQIEPAGVFFISVKKLDDPRNEWPHLLELLRRLVDAGDRLLRHGVRHAALQLIAEHERYVRNEEESARSELEGRMSKAEDELRNMRIDQAGGSAKGDAGEQLAELRKAWEGFEARAKHELGRLLDQANVIPAPSRDIAHKYLESKRSGFRVGLLFSERKTASERERRLREWREEAERQADAQVRWHVADLLRRLAEEWSLPQDVSEAAAAVIDRVRFPITEEWLASLVQGGHFDDAYTITYAKTVADQIKLQYRRLAYEALEQLQRLIKPLFERRSADLEARHRLELERNEARQALDEMERRLAGHIKGLRRLFDGIGDDRELPLDSILNGVREALRQHRARQTEGESSVSEPVHAARQAERKDIGRMWEQADNHHSQIKLKQLASRLRRASELIRDLPMFGGFRRTLIEKAERLENNQYTIALFGAFSAGKSSFANALLHTRLLPVSPNPTTAAINSVLPPSGEVRNGQAVLHYKTREAMLADVRLSMDKLHLPMPDGEDDIPAAIDRADLRSASAGAKVHVAFLRAVRNGWEHYRPKLGGKETVDVGAYRRAVADETQACFLEKVDLYADSAFARQGMILVDTPGADSINARHTDVAFNYIKNADAILFVTYYNHAFSHADREFLLQLGRVKDMFAMNKMFFIVNAADLASDEAELGQVVEHVRHNLETFGIRQPRIFPVSSMRAIQALESGDESAYAASGLPAFEAEFYQFVHHELAEMSLRGGEAELGRVREALAEWIAAMAKAQQDRETQTRKLEQGRENAVRLLADGPTGRRIDELRKEIQELIYYVAQRVSFRFGELYNVAFNPSTFADASIGDKDKLNAAYDELLHYLSYDMSQELRATTMRIEAFMERQLSQIYDAWSQQLHEMLQGFATPQRAAVEWEIPACEVELAADADEWKTIRSAYRGNRHFFEQGGKQALKQSLEQSLAERLKRLAAEQQQTFLAHYERVFDEAAKAMAERLAAEAAAYADATIEALRADVSLADYERLLEQLA